MENSERLGRQARLQIEPGTSRLPVFECSHWWSQGRTARHPCLIRDSNPEPLVQQPASLTTAPFGRQQKRTYVYKFTYSLKCRFEVLM